MGRLALVVLTTALSAITASGQHVPPPLPAGGDEHWDPRFGELGLNGSVLATTPALDGSLYIGGNFTLAGGLPVNRIALWNGDTWFDVGGGLDGEVSVLLADPESGDLYAGGSFQTAGGIPANYIARWDGEQWHSLGSGTSRRVESLYIDPNTGNLYAGGGFVTAGDVTVNGISRWDGEIWHALDNGIQGIVFDIHSYNSSDIIVAGDISTAGGLAVNDIARWDGLRWAAFGDPGLIEIRTLEEMEDGTMLAGGLLDNPGDPLISALSPSDTAWTPFLTDVYSGEECSLVVTDIASSEDHTYVGGGQIICTPEGFPDYTNTILELSSDEWINLGSGLNGLAMSLTLIEDDLYVGGSFSEAGGQPSLNFARWNETKILPIQPLTHGPIQPTKIDLYPNPATHYINLRIHATEQLIYNLYIHDVLGRLLHHSIVNGHVADPDEIIIMDISDLSQSIYMIIVTIRTVSGREERVVIPLAKL